MPLLLPRVYSAIELPSDETYRLRSPDDAVRHARELGIPEPITRRIEAELGERASTGDSEDFLLGVALFCVEVSVEAGLDRETGEFGAEAFSFIDHAPGVAMAMIACDTGAAAVHGALLSAITAGRLGLRN